MDLLPSRKSHDLAPNERLTSAADATHALNETFRLSIAEAESYLALYDARAKLEEDYVRGLRALTERQRVEDVKLDARVKLSVGVVPGTSDLPGARRAWREMRENDLREIDTRLHHIETLRQGVIAPLVAYRDSQERIRKRVKEDLKTSCGRYDEMRYTTLPRVRRAYERKCEEVEQIRMQQEAVEEQRILLSAPSTTSMARNASQPGSSDRSSAGGDAQDAQGGHYSDGGMSMSPASDAGAFPRNATASPRRANTQKERSHARKVSSGSIGASGALSDREDEQGYTSPGGTSTDKAKPNFLDVLRSKDGWEQARKEAPKKLNAFISRMREGAERGGSGVERGVGAALSFGGGGGGSVGDGQSYAARGDALGQASGSIKSAQNMALKGIKLKREADEADKVYRKCVFDLETLRLRREKTMAAAGASVIESRRELYLTAQAVWLQNERSGLALHSSGVSLHQHAESIITHATDNLDAEMQRVEQRLPKLDMLEEAPVPYVNFFHGESRDLLFGVSLVDYAFNRAQRSAPTLGPSKVEPPLIVRKCIKFIEEKALDQPGIYRISAKHTAIQNMAHAVEKDEERFEFNEQDEPSTVAGLLKLYLRQLPEAVMPMPWEERIKHTHEREEHMRTGFAQLKGRIRRLPPINQATLKAVVEHLAKIAAHSEQNKMTASNLSVVFGPVLLSEADHETTSIAAAMDQDNVLEDMITYADTVLDLSTAGAPILPSLAKPGAPMELPQHTSGTLQTTQLAADAPVSASPVASSADSPLVLTGTAGLKRSNAIALGPQSTLNAPTSAPLDVANPSAPLPVATAADPAPAPIAPSAEATLPRPLPVPVPTSTRPPLPPRPSDPVIPSFTPTEALASTLTSSGTADPTSSPETDTLSLHVEGWSKAPAPPPRGPDGKPFLGKRRENASVDAGLLVLPTEAGAVDAGAGAIGEEGPVSAVSNSSAYAETGHDEDVVVVIGKGKGKEREVSLDEVHGQP